MNSDIGKIILSLRKKKMLTQQELSEIMKSEFDLKTDRATIGKWEIGFQEPALPALKALSSIFGVSLDYFNGISENKERTIRKIPVLGIVQAGIPIEAVENILDYEEISDEMGRNGDFFALKIKGASMEPRMTDGDVIIVRQQNFIEDGEIAVVLVNGDSATVKKIKKHPRGITLVATNTSAYEPHFYTNEEVETLPVQVIGKVVELRAKF